MSSARHALLNIATDVWGLKISNLRDEIEIMAKKMAAGSTNDAERLIFILINSLI